VLQTVSCHLLLPASAPHIDQRLRRRVAAECMDALEPVDDLGERTRFLAAV
jgi:hypothetical protein